MTDSGALLQEYVVGRSEAAFGQLVTRHVDMVYSTALRVVGGDAHLARDVTQIVFADLAHKARSLPANLVLGGWLHQHTFFVAAQTVRAEKRRQAREKEAVFMQDSNEASSDSVWQQLAPVLDEAMARLRTRDRDAIVLRYFEQKPLRAVGQALGISEEAARKRIDRAVTALKSLLIRRGVTLSTAAIATFLSVQSVSAAPTGMAAAALASAAAAKSAAGGAGLAASVMNLVIMTKLQVTVVGLLFLAGAATPFILSSAVDSWSGRQARLQPQPPALAKGAQSVASTPAEGAQSDQLEAGSPLGRLASWLRRADQSHRRSDHDQDELEFLVWSLPAADYPKAWRLREGIRPGEIRNRFQWAILSYWVDLDARAAMAAAQTCGGWNRSDPATVVLRSWTQREPLAALGWIRQSAPEQNRAKLLSAAIPKAAKVDPSTAIAAVEEVPAGWLRDRALSGAVREWATHAPKAAARYVADLAATPLCAELMKSLAQGWAEKDANAAFEWAQQLEQGRERDGAYEGILFGLAEKDPASAATILGRLGENELATKSSRYVDTIVRNWARSDVAAAAKWTQQLWAKNLSLAGDSDWRHSSRMMLEQTTDALLRQWCDKDPRSAGEFALALPGENSRQMEVVLAGWCSQDSQAALQWASGLEPGPARDAALKGFCQGLANAQPMEAAHFVAGMPLGELQSQAAVEVVYRWAITDPQAAAQWVLAFPEGRTREQAARRLMDGWNSSGADTSAAARWLAQLPAGGTRDRAAQAFVAWAWQSEPELAAPWVGAIADEQRRSYQSELVARRWLDRDPEAARKWIANAPLTEAKKRELLSR